MTMENETLRQESRNKIRKLLNKTDGIETELSPDETKELEEEIKNLEQRVEELEAEVESLEKDLKELQDETPNDLPTTTLISNEVVELIRQNFNKLVRNNLLFEEFLNILE